MTRALAILLLACFACDEGGAPAEMRTLRSADVPAYLRMVGEDREKLFRGVQEAARRVVPAFRDPDVDASERASRVTTMLERIDAERRGVAELVFSPVLYLGATDGDGELLAQKGARSGDLVGVGADYAGWDVVKEALAGRAGHAVVDLADVLPADEGPIDTWLFAAPIFVGDAEVAGAFVAGIPLWREAQRLTAQIRLESAERVASGEVLWAYLVRGPQAYASREPPASTDITDAIPDAAARAAGLATKPDGYVTQMPLFRRWYGLAVIPLPTLAEDVHLVAFRANAMD
ncbi:MAG: hypothetical protein AAGH15_20740 [Myxococcota bacterium]